jgi:wyosine [tRNA(Phe)-imidazoG37] synthetase (radical SAM superfamily)
MATFLFDEIIFGPVKSRRLGISLGINLLPTDSKLCNFNCIYCECGWTPGKKEMKVSYHPRQVVAEKLEETLQDMIKNENAPGCNYLLPEMVNPPCILILRNY